MIILRREEIGKLDGLEEWMGVDEWMGLDEWMEWMIL